MQEALRRSAASPLPYVLFIMAALPVEPHVASVFIRPVYLVGALAYLLFCMSPPWRISRATAPYYATSFMLVLYLIINGFVNKNMASSLKEVVEVVITAGIFWFGCRAAQAVGMPRFLITAGRVFFVAALAHMAMKFGVDHDYLSFKDAYYVILFSCVISTIEIRHSRNLEAQLRLAVSVFILILSGSRTGWLAYLLFGVVAYGIGFRQFLFICVCGVLLLVISNYNTQTGAYLNTIFVMAEAVSSVSFDDLQGWLEVAASFENPSDMYRLTEIVRAILMIGENPFFGVGIDQFITYGYKQMTEIGGDSIIGAHNELLRILSEGGVFLFAITVSYYLFALSRARDVQDKRLQRTCLALLAASLGMFMVSATNFMITFLVQLSLIWSTTDWATAGGRGRGGKSEPEAVPSP